MAEIRCAALVAFALATLSSVPAEADRLVLRDGQARAGSVTACDDEACTVSGKRVDRSTIAWILLGNAQPPSSTAPASTDQAVLADGSTASGPFAGLSAGVVLIGDAELDRANVRAIRLADLVAGSAHLPPSSEGAEGAPVLDAVALVDGSARIGELVGCVGASCELAEGGALARSTIVAIAFGGGAGKPATTGGAGEPGDRDRLVLRTGGNVETTVYAIDPDAVFTASGTYERAAVSAVVFAAAPQSGAVGTGGPGAPPAAAGESGGAPAPPPAAGGAAGTSSAPPSSPPPPPPTPAGPAGAASAEARPGALWRGWIQGTYAKRYPGSWDTVTFRADIVAREWIRTYVIGGGEALDAAELWPVTVTISQRFDSDDGSATCSGSGTTGWQEGHPVGAYTLKKRDVDLTAYLGIDPPVGGGYYRLSLWPRIDVDDHETHCTGFHGQWTGRGPFASSIGLIGREPRGTRAPAALSDTELRWLDGGRMQGSYSTVYHEFHHTTVSWSLCRDGADCPGASPPPPAEPPAPTPCGRPSAAGPLSETCHSQFELAIAELAPHLAEYDRLMGETVPLAPDFERMKEWCEFYDDTKLILETILTGGAGRAAEAGRALMYLRDLIGRVQNGTLGELFYPSQVKTFLKHYKNAKEVWFELTADDLAKMQRDLSACSGKAPIEIYMNAKKFIETLTAAKGVWASKVAPGLNDLRSKGYECAHLDWMAWRDCLAQDECEGAPADCGPVPSLDALATPYDDRR